MQRDGPHTTAIYADHIALVIGQIPEEDAPESWPVPPGDHINTTMSTASVRDGEPLDPPLITVHVYSGMEFYDEREGRTVTVDRARWFAFQQDDDLDYSRPDDPVEVEFEEDLFPDDRESPTLALSGNELAHRIASGRYRNVTGEADGEGA